MADSAAMKFRIETTTVDAPSLKAQFYCPTCFTLTRQVSLYELWINGLTCDCCGLQEAPWKETAERSTHHFPITERLLNK